jgi:hypothetical protein
MKTKIKVRRPFYALVLTSVVFSACQKQEVSSTESAASGSSTIAIASSAKAAVVTDSVYLMQPCGPGGKRDSIGQADLPASATSYLQANYNDFVFAKAFEIVDRTENTTGYVAVIYYNDNPVGVLFDAAGNFVRVLEQREKGDLNGPGFHRGGRFEHRDGKGKDSVALSALPANVTSYFATNYASDTLVKAFKNRDSSYVVLSKNNGAFATVFDESGNFISRVQLFSKQGSCNAIEQSALPSATLSYLTTTYPNYVFKKAFSISENGTIKGYVVFIDANNTKYAVSFDSAGNFISAKTVH